jgi:nitrite reductase/ring-hydroxylating ferredoxin subunit
MDPECWKYSRGKVKIQWGRTPELRKPCGAIRLEGRGLPERILVIYGIDGQFHALRNRCSHCGRQLDPILNASAVHCCSLTRSNFDYAGNVISGSAKQSLVTFRVATNKCIIVVWLNEW